MAEFQSILTQSWSQPNHITNKAKNKGPQEKVKGVAGLNDKPEDLDLKCQASHPLSRSARRLHRSELSRVELQKNTRKSSPELIRKAECLLEAKGQHQVGATEGCWDTFLPCQCNLETLKQVD